MSYETQALLEADYDFQLRARAAAIQQADYLKDDPAGQVPVPVVLGFTRRCHRARVESPVRPHPVADRHVHACH